MASCNNREYQRNYMKMWRKRGNNAKKQSLSARKWQLANPIRNAWNEYRKRASNKSIKFSLTYDQFAELLKSPCCYCGIEADPTNGIDRMDNADGYTERNSITACSQCNYAKNNIPVAQFTEWLLRAASHIQRMN